MNKIFRSVISIIIIMSSVLLLGIESDTMVLINCLKQEKDDLNVQKVAKSKKQYCY